MANTINPIEMLKEAMDLGLTKEEAMSFVKDCMDAMSKTQAPKTPTGAKAPKKSKTEEKPQKEEKVKKEFDIEDVKFDKYNDGNCNWSYYKEVRKAYCYRRQGCKVWKGTITKPEGFKFNEEQWEADKKAFEAKYPYIKKADRK
jgi:hypothetical protein